MMCRRVFTASLGAALVSGCVTHQTGPVTGLEDLPPRYKPAPDSDEAGIWLACEKVEQDMRRSATRIRDQGITQLVADVACRLSSGHCPDLRAYVVRTPVPNATAYPNGMIQTWSGMLLRMTSESELAAVMGHELTHYIRRHSLARMRDIRATTDLMAFLGLGLGVAGAPVGTADLANLIALGSIMSFSRDHESEADTLGLKLMADCGYDPFAASAVWRRFIDLRKTSGKEQDFDFFLSSHPADEDRERSLLRLAEQRGHPKAAPPDRLRDAIAPIRFQMLTDEVNLGRFKQSQRLFDILLGDDKAPGELTFFKGELHRKRAKDDDEVLALGYYHQACEMAGAPPEAFRLVGIIRWRRGEKEQAREYFRRYLVQRPDAPDKALIANYLGGA